MKSIKNEKGFTLVEMLGALFIIILLMGASISIYTKYRRDSIKKSYNFIEQNMITAAENYFMDNPKQNSVTMDRLVEGKYLEDVVDPETEENTCSGKVIFLNDNMSYDTKKIKTGKYKVALKCEKYENCLVKNSNLKCVYGEGLKLEGRHYPLGLKNLDISYTMIVKVKIDNITEKSSPEGDEPRLTNIIGNIYYNKDGGNKSGGRLGLTSDNRLAFEGYDQNNNYILYTSNSKLKTNQMYVFALRYYKSSDTQSNIQLYIDGIRILTKDKNETEAYEQPFTGVLGAGEALLSLGPKNEETPNDTLSVQDVLILNKAISYFNPNRFQNYISDVDYTKDTIGRAEKEKVIYSMSFN